MAPATMLLLDHNLPHQLRELLATYEMKAETAASRGWQSLQNGDLVAAAYAAGFETIFTRDAKFAESASKSLKTIPTISVVVITIPQRSWKLYADAFRTAWNQNPAIPKPGQVIFWP